MKEKTENKPMNLGMIDTQPITPEGKYIYYTKEHIDSLNQEIADLTVILNKTGDLIDQKKEFIKFLNE